ncbi:MAG TPA: dynamin family protein, partial [Vicinamibacterales bacterium]|nr:dynamin family protein [Vicinamibacterales bacterium]
RGSRFARLGAMSLKGILDPAEQELVREERRILNDLRASLIRFGASDENLAPLEQSIAQLDELFLLVVVGEFNAGKSAFINALAGTRVMEEGVTPTTAQVTPVRLDDINIVDTPGTNAVIREHEEITSGFVPRADLVLFVTSADRPFTETERAFLEQIRDWGKKVVVVINKVDILSGAKELDEVRSYVADNARRLLGVTPEIFPVSAKMAFRAKNGEPQLWSSSGFEALERYIRTTLDSSARMRLKLQNPLGVGAALIDRYSAATRDRLGMLQSDFTLLEDVESQLAGFERDMAREFEGRMATVDNVLLEMERRGHDFFDDTMRIGRVMDLLNRSRVQEGFERQVVADAPQQIEKRVNELIDWMVDADFRQWQRITRHLSDRRREFRDRIVGTVRDDEESRPFHDERRRMVETVGGAAQTVVETYDRRREASELADGARNAVAAAAAAGAGAVGLGTLIAAAASTAAADITGILLASVIAALGFFIIPAKRKQAKAEMRAKIADVRERLSQALRTQFEGEIGRSTARMRESIAPYSRFVRAEGDKLRETDARLAQLRTDLGNVRRQVDAMAA